MVMLPLLLWLSAVQDVRVDPVCTADIRWTTTAPMVVSRNGARVVTTMGTLSQPPLCGPAELRLTVGYFDANDQLICSGTVQGLAFQPDVTQMTAIEVRPGNLVDFVRWKNGPAAPNTRFQPLRCQSADSSAIVQPADLDLAASLRMYATIVARYGGVATAELTVVLR